MAARLAGRLITSPLAFVVGGLLDMVRYLIGAAGNRVHRRRALSTMPSDADRAPAP